MFEVLSVIIGDNTHLRCVQQLKCYRFSLFSSRNSKWMLLSAFNTLNHQITYCSVVMA